MASAAGWAVVVPLLVVAGARLIAWDARSTLVALNSLTPVLFLPAWAVAALAALTRRVALLSASVVVVIAQVLFMLPELLAREPVPELVPGASALRLYSANVYAANTNVAGQAEEIRRSRPDIVFLQEATPAFLAALEASGAIGELPHRVVVPRTDPFAAVLASRLPLLDHDVVEVDGRPVVVRATIAAEGVPIRLYAVHVVAPVGGSRQAWAKELQVVADMARAESQPVLMAGDFNATWSNRPFRRLLDAGLTDAAAARGRPLQMTWPRDVRFVPPLTRIDHVLTNATLTVTSIRTGRGRGSDHRPVVADVARVRMEPAGSG